MSDQVPTVSITAAMLMHNPNFRRGFEDARAGRSPCFDRVDAAWAYERGRLFAFIAPINMPLFVNAKLNKKALALLEAAHARKLIT